MRFASYHGIILLDSGKLGCHHYSSMKTCRIICAIPLIVVLLLGTIAPPSARGGHGIDDAIEVLSLPAERVKQLIDGGEKLTFIDTRPAKEYQQTRLPQARSIPLEELANRLDEVPKTGRVIFYCDCKTYDIAERVVLLVNRGHRNVFILPDGYSGWLKRGYLLDTARR